MRIDVGLIPQILGLAKPPSEKAGVSFAALFSALPPQAGEAGIGGGTVLPRNVFSFDALGTLGVGGLVETGAPVKAGKAPHPETPPPPQALASPAVETSPAPEALAAPPTQSPAQAPSPDAAPPAGSPRLAGGPAGAAPGPYSASGSGPAGAGSIQAPVSTAPLRIFANVCALTAEAPEEAPPARKAVPSSRFQAEADPPPEGISVVLSETGGTLNIVASAPGLAESDRQTLKRVADETAGDAGIPLGELRLNGVAVRPFSKVS